MKQLLPVLSLAFFVAAAACGGAVKVDPIGAPDGPDGYSGGDPTGADADSTGADADSKKPIPPQPVGPYDGVVGTTDVSILYPLPASGEVVDFVRPAEIGNHGALLPEAMVRTVLAPFNRLDLVHAEPPTKYPQLALISLRLDPCGARGVPAGSCKSEVRAVFQAIYEKAAGVEGDPVAGTAATDGAIHVLYDVPAPELVTMLEEILTLKKANGGLALQELAPHPILKAQGLGGAFAQGLRNIVLSHLGGDRVGRVTMFDHNFNPDMDGWTFKSFERDGAGLVQKSLPGFPSSDLRMEQTIAGTSTSHPLESSSADDFSGGLTDSVGPLVHVDRAAPGTPAADALKSTFAAVLKVQDPTVHTSESTSCGNCHLAEGARKIGDLVYGFSPENAFSHPRSLAYVHDQPTATNLHAFGYLHRKVSIMQRTANESVLVAAQMEALVQ